MSKVKRITYSLFGANCAGERRHPQEVMSELGIGYEHATPQSISDLWWFWIPSNIPADIPKFITVSQVNPMKSVGFGLSKKEAKRIIEIGGLSNARH